MIYPLIFLWAMLIKKLYKSRYFDHSLYSFILFWGSDDFIYRRISRYNQRCIFWILSTHSVFIGTFSCIDLHPRKILVLFFMTLLLIWDLEPEKLWSVQEDWLNPCPYQNLSSHKQVQILLFLAKRRKLLFWIWSRTVHLKWFLQGKSKEDEHFISPKNLPSFA